MGLLESIFRPNKREDAVRAATTFKTLTAYRPAFTSWGGAIYESDLVRAAIDARARHISKLKVETYGSAKPGLQAKLRLGPNGWQTWSQFLYRASTILDVEGTVFIVPVVDEYLQPTGYFPILPRRCSVVEFNGEPWLRYEFNNGQRAATRLDDVAIMTRFQYQSDFFGDGNRALSETMALIHLQNEGITEAVKNSASYRFIATMDNWIKAEDLVKERKRFSRENLAADAEGDNGVLLFPSNYKDIKQVDIKPYTVDAGQMALIRSNIYHYYAVNEKVLTSSANGDELDAFYNGSIENWAIQFSEVMSKAAFSERERAQGSGIMATANRLQYMSVNSKVQMAKELADHGAIMVDEIRELFNYPPLPDGTGQVVPIRGEYKAVESLVQEDQESNENDNNEEVNDDQ